MDPDEKKRFNPWPIGLFLSLALFVVVQSSAVYLACSTFEGLDDVQYYRHGVEYGQEIARQKEQRDLGWRLSPRWEGNSLLLAVQDADGKPIMKAQVTATVGRPATQRADRQIALQEVGPGIYQAPVTLMSGKWRVRFRLSKGDSIVKAEFRKDGGRG